MSKRVEPIILTCEDGREYVLEFNRASVEYSERRGFKVEDVVDAKLSSIGDIFFYSFRMHHPMMTKTQTDDLLYGENGIGGLTTDMLERLAELYLAPFNTLIRDEGETKNSRWTIRL